MPALEPASDAVEWSPPKRDEASGIAMHRDYPLNRRLRAEALADDGKHEDADGLVSPELIADAKARLDGERAAAEEAARNAPSMRWTEKQLRDHAATIPGLAVETDANKAAILAAIEGAAGTPQTEA